MELRMSWPLLIEQTFNGVQFGLVLFLLAAGVTLVFGVMNMVNLAHGSLLMMGGYLLAEAQSRTGSWLLAAVVGLAGVAVLGYLVERLVVRRLYARNHLEQVLATFGLLLCFNETVVWIWGREPVPVELPSMLRGHVELLPEIPYPTYRLAVSLVALCVAVALWFLIARTRIGMLIRAGAERRQLVEALGVNIGFLYAVVFALGAVLAGLGGVLLGPLLTVQPGMGDPLLILALAVVIVGGAGSIAGTFVASLVLGIADTHARTLLPLILGDGAGRSLAAMAVYLLMALTLIFKPTGIFGRAGEAE
jgi:branched-chain amino acid transport system permease protein